jgi:hypothetical protein
MNTEMISALWSVVSAQVLIALRNHLINLLSECSDNMRFRLYSDNAFMGVLDMLDPELPCAAKDVEEALKAFELGPRFVNA